VAANKELARLKLRSLERLIGTWSVGDEGDGTATFEWFDEGTAILGRLQIGDVRRIDVIRYDEADDALCSCYFDRATGELVTYRYSIDEDLLVIEAEAPGHHGAFVARFRDEDRVLEGHWQWLEGRYQPGYDARWTRQGNGGART
jgi:hypothetical protein